MRSYQRLGLAAVSGLFIGIADVHFRRLLPLPFDYQWHIENCLGAAWFAMLVLVPFLSAPSMRTVRIIGLVGVCILSMFIATEVESYDPSPFFRIPYSTSVTAASVVAALIIAAGTSGIAQLQVTWLMWPYAILAGMLGGGVFVLGDMVADYFTTWQSISPSDPTALRLPTQRFPTVIAMSIYAFWHTFVCAALLLGQDRN
jgi:hypothetical protein